MKFCENCGTLIRDGENFCSNCGAASRNKQGKREANPETNKGTSNFIAVAVIVVVVVALVFWMVGGDESDLVGSWYREDDRSSPVVTFYSDGTCILDGEYGTCEWDIVDGKLKIITVYRETYVFGYELSGNKLILSEHGEKAVFIKK